MAHLFQPTRVQYLCTCGLSKPITEVYFCRHCLMLRCGNCVCYEIDALYCPHCLENMPSNEARLKKNRCANCFDCPSCGHTLSTRGTSAQVPNPEDPSQTVSKKVYYLGCTNCKWASRDVGLDDQPHATIGWPEKDSLYEQRVQELMEHYRGVAQKEKFDAESKKSPRKKTFLSLPEKYSLSSTFSSLSSRKSLTPFATKFQIDSGPGIEPSEAVEHIAGLPDSIFTEPLTLTTLSTIEQRLVSPEWQPEHVEDMHPFHKHLIVKCSRRCRQCERNLSKPEYNPSSIKFKIQLGAYYHVPEVRIMKSVDFKKGITTTVQLSLCNPTSHDITATFLPFIPDIYLCTKDVDETAQTSMTALGSLVRVLDLPKEKCELKLTADVTLPQGQLTLFARDDTAGYDEVEVPQHPNDDPQVIAWRKCNKVGVNVEVKTDMDDGDVTFGFILRYDYTNTVATATEDRSVTLNVPVIVNVGRAHP